MKVLKKYMKKIWEYLTRVNNSFEIFYLDKDQTVKKNKQEMIDSLISLIGEYSCFIKYSCDNNVFLEYKILNYIKQDKIYNKIEVEKFEGINDEMLEARLVEIYFMPKDYKWEDFISHNYFYGNIFKKYNIKLILGLDDLGHIFVRYNPSYHSQIKTIIKKEYIQ